MSDVSDVMSDVMPDVWNMLDVSDVLHVSDVMSDVFDVMSDG